MLYPWQQAPWLQFQAMRQQQRMPHALLLSGLKGLGKTAFANKLVASLLCQQPAADVEACGECHSCLLLAAGNHPDHHVVSPEEPGKQIKVDQIRHLKASQTLMPKVSAGKTVLITEADSMNISAFNSLLKLLEEPQPDTVLILISENGQQLPVTIKSRCQTLLMPAPDAETAQGWLLEQSPELSAADCQSLLKLTHGAPLQALAIREYGLAQSQQISRDMGLLMKTQVNPVLMAAQWQNYDLLSVMQQIQNMMQAKITSLMTGEAPVSQALIKQYWALTDCILHTIKLLSTQNNPNKILLIEEFMVSVMQHAQQIRLLQERK